MARRCATVVKSPHTKQKELALLRHHRHFDVLEVLENLKIQQSKTKCAFENVILIFSNPKDV